MFLCTPIWLMENHNLGDVVADHQLLIVFRYDFEAIVRRLLDYCKRCEGEGWCSIVRQLHALGRWEFETSPNKP